MDALTLDGNALAGLLREVFEAEMTSAVGTCAACEASAPIGAVLVYRGAGYVLRCPHCENILVTVVESERTVRIGLPGTRALTIPRAAAR